MPHEMTRTAVFCVAGKGELTDSSTNIEVLGVVTPNLFAIPRPGAIAIFLSSADRTRPAPA